MKTTSSVLIVYEEAASREAAVKFCDALVQRFWQHTEFDLSWWALGHLDQADRAKEAAAKAASADMILFALQPGPEAPLSARAWIESWLPQRQGREGRLIELLEANAEAGSTPRHLFLRHAAHRAGMDYATKMPDDLWVMRAETPDAYRERAGRVTSVLHEILRQRPRPAPRI